MLGFLKNKKRKGVVGIEIRADGLAIAVAKRDAETGRNKVVKAMFIACNAAARKDTLTELVKEHGLEGYTCHLVLPADQYQTYPVEKPKVEDAELGDAVRWKIKDMLDFDLEHAVTDTYEFPEDALRGRPEQINVIVSRKTIIQGYVDLIRSTDMELEVIDVADLSLRNIAAIESEEGRAVAMLYLRHGAGMMVLVKDNKLYLARKFDFSLESLNNPSQQDSVIQNLGLEIQRSFDYFESQMGQMPPQTMALVGPDPNIPLANMMGGAIAARVTQFDWTHCLPEDIVIGPEHINSVVAIGAAIREVTA